MRFRRFYADVQDRADAFIAVPLRDQFNDRSLSRREHLVRVALSGQHAILVHSKRRLCRTAYERSKFEERVEWKWIGFTVRDEAERT